MKFPIYVGILLGLAFAFGMVVGAKILYDILQGAVVPANYLKPSHYLGGGLFGGPLAYLAIVTPAALLFARDRRRALDLIALTLPIPMIVAKVACFANGCCYGVRCDLPWAVTFPPGAVAPAGIPRHPTALYEIAVLLVILAIFVFPRPATHTRWRPAGSLLGWFVALYGLGRPLTEVFRGDDRGLPVFGPFTPSQLLCLAAGVIATCTLLFVWTRSEGASNAQRGSGIAR
jgi:phosphatidylglycerol:prolipoprotein diacylglycerol transferase